MKRVLLLLPLLTACSHKTDAVPVAYSQPYAVVTAGQSNMIGMVSSGGVQAFADTLRQSGRTVPQLMVIPCAIGGSRISEWQKGTPNYDACVQKVVAARIPIYAILFWQGENDALYGDSSWDIEYLAFLSNFKNDIGAPSVPSVHARLSDLVDRSWALYLDSIRQEQIVTASNDSWANLDGLSAGSDLIHFDGVACREAGRRFALALEELI